MVEKRSLGARVKSFFSDSPEIMWTGVGTAIGCGLYMLATGETPDPLQLSGIVLVSNLAADPFAEGILPALKDASVKPLLDYIEAYVQKPWRLVVEPLEAVAMAAGTYYLAAKGYLPSIDLGLERMPEMAQNVLAHSKYIMQETAFFLGGHALAPIVTGYAVEATEMLFGPIKSALSWTKEHIYDPFIKPALKKAGELTGKALDKADDVIEGVKY